MGNLVLIDLLERVAINLPEVKNIFAKCGKGKHNKMRFTSILIVCTKITNQLVFTRKKKNVCQIEKEVHNSCFLWLPS